jgi:hypoxanthine phosphoribosyltransferase
VRPARVAYSPHRLSVRVGELGRAISRDFSGRTLDVVAILENSFLFAADLIRKITRPVVIHFVRVETRDVQFGGYPRREIFFSRPPALAGRDVLVVDTVLHTGVTLDFLMKRLEESRPRTLRLAVLLDKSKDRKVDLRAAYVGFAAASKHWVGYGLAGPGGRYRNLSYVGAVGTSRARLGKKRESGRAKRSGSKRSRG